MGWGLEEPDPTDEDLSEALTLLALGWKPTYTDVFEVMPWSVVRAALDLKSGQSARNNAESQGSGPAFGTILTADQLEQLE